MPDSVIRIDLKHPDLRNDKPYFQRVKRALENEAFTNQSLQFTWDPSDSSICPSSAAAYFNSQNCTVRTCHTKVKVHRERSLRCPKYDPKSGKDVDGPHELVEYLSMRMLSCDMDRNEILNSYCENLDTEDVDTALMVHCKGFFSASFINRLWNELRKISLEPWSALCVNGFEFTPLTFFNREHTFTTNGDNNFAILHYPGNAFLLYQNSSSNKKQY
ncbi:unnamed protein product [Hermetia illucens]|uniref:Uncharacterized protein n=1 Tax=Hermetia illucens TaxID=343691 RepID=A0A7R8V1P0_HERIL|nr:unnamed protein product [Hermetia illucens]